MNIIVTGSKSSGKSTIGKSLAETLSMPFIDLDDIVLDIYNKENETVKSCAEIFRNVGEQQFRKIEQTAITEALQRDFSVLATGGSTLLNSQSRKMLRADSIWIYLDASFSCLWSRISSKPLPAFLEGVEDIENTYKERMELLNEIVEPRCDIQIEVDDKPEADIVKEIIDAIQYEFAVKSTSPNTIGEVIRLTTFGESHGPMIGAVLDGVQPGLPLCEEDIQKDLDRRRPGQSKVSTARKESDKVQIVSGVFEGKTTGTPIGLIIRNSDSKSSHYDTIKEIFRPGHADYTFWQKYGIRDYRGGGRSSGRETATRVAGGAVAKKILAEKGVTIRAFTTQIGKIKADSFDYGTIESNSVRCPDIQAAKEMEKLIVELKDKGDSVGGVAQIEITGLPAGLGDPIFAKLDSKLAAALFSLGAVKGVEFGAGFKAAEMTGSENNDQMSGNDFVSNNAGGILGGISSGQPLTARVAVKPTPSITGKQMTKDIHGETKEIQIMGRHDPCIVPRIVPVLESMAALVLLDAWEIQSRINPKWQTNS
ncbi:MAG: chorismate synthase [Sedimentisphaeraceae bacterium JB056]